MANFSVEIEGVTGKGPQHPQNHEGCQGRWVLAVDAERDRVLVAYADQTLHWHDLSECTFAGMVNPAGAQSVVAAEPIPVVVVKPGPAPLSSLSLPPMPNGGGP